MLNMINPDTPRQIMMAVKAYAQKYPYIKEGAQLFTVRGPVRVKALAADLAGHITVECADGKKYDGAYFGLYASRSNAPDAVVSAYDAATRMTWKQPNPQPLMSPAWPPRAPAHATRCAWAECQPTARGPSPRRHGSPCQRCR